MKRIMHLLLTVCLLTSNLGYAWNWPWDSNAAIYNNMTPLERAQAYRYEVIDPIISNQIQFIQNDIQKEERKGVSNSIAPDESRPFDRQCVNKVCDDAAKYLAVLQAALNFHQKHGADAYLGLIEWPDYVNRPKARDNILQNEAAFKLKYELTNRQFDELEEQLKVEYPGLERKKETRAFFSPMEPEKPLLTKQLVSSAPEKWQNFQKGIGTTWRTTVPESFAGSKFSGGSGLLDRLKQWWQSKSGQYSIRQSLNNKAEQIQEQYKQSTPSTFGEAKFRGGSQFFQKLRESWQNRTR
jgi:hypothetical protein